MSDVTKTTCPDADELADIVRELFAGGGVAGGITRQLSNGERYTIQPWSFHEAVEAKRQAALATAQTEAAELRALIGETYETLKRIEQCAEEPLVIASAKEACDKIDAALRVHGGSHG